MTSVLFYFNVSQYVAAPKIFQKTNISPHSLICKRTFAYQEYKNVSFSFQFLKL